MSSKKEIAIRVALILLLSIAYYKLTESVSSRDLFFGIAFGLILGEIYQYAKKGYAPGELE
jgi:hypothetical protein